jgi:phosphoribosylaminoimidazole carboxylase PurE protein
MGSASDWEVMRHAVELLREFQVPHKAEVLSAHRMPFDMLEYGRTAKERGLKVIIAGGAGCAGSITPSGGRGFPAVDRADAARHPGRDIRHW